MPDGENFEQERRLGTVVVTPGGPSRAQILGNLPSYTYYTETEINPNYSAFNREYTRAVMPISEGIDYNTYIGREGFQYVGAFYDNNGNAAEYYVDTNALARNPENGPTYYQRSILEENNIYGTGSAQRLDRLPPEIAEKIDNIQNFTENGVQNLTTLISENFDELIARTESVEVLHEPMGFGRGALMPTPGRRGLGNDYSFADRFKYYGVQTLPDGRDMALFRETPLYIDGVQQNAGMAYIVDPAELGIIDETVDARLVSFSDEINPIASPELMPFVAELDESWQIDRMALENDLRELPFEVLWPNGDVFIKVGNEALFNNSAFNLDEDGEYTYSNAGRREYIDPVDTGVDPQTGNIVYINRDRPDLGALVDPQSGEIVNLFSVREDNGMCSSNNSIIPLTVSTNAYSLSGGNSNVSMMAYKAGNDFVENTTYTTLEMDNLNDSTFCQSFIVRSDLLGFSGDFKEPTIGDLSQYYGNQSIKVGGQELYEAGTGFLVTGADIVDSGNNAVASIWNGIARTYNWTILPGSLSETNFQLTQTLNFIPGINVQTMDASIATDRWRNWLRSDVMGIGTIERADMSGAQRLLDDVITVGELYVNARIGVNILKGRSTAVQATSLVGGTYVGLGDAFIVGDNPRDAFYMFAQYGDISGTRGGYEGLSRKYLQSLIENETYSDHYSNILQTIHDIPDTESFHRATNWLVARANSDISVQPNMSLVVPAEYLEKYNEQCLTQEDLESAQNRADLIHFIETGDEQYLGSSLTALEQMSFDLMELETYDSQSIIDPANRSALILMQFQDGEINVDEFKSKSEELINDLPEEFTNPDISNNIICSPKGPQIQP